ncbi:MAG: SulP family inorganic anion transporter [Verrucomicrobiaceae bacterium]|nr:MAG: SulP family inorganic anion transporter [Verrucomicrobiaceae bacterium]
MTLSKFPTWTGNIRGDLLSGLVVALALIPEAIAFSIIAGVAPQVGLYASFCIAVVSAFAGGRPAMISAATGAMALLMVTLVRDHGLQYLFATTILTGVLQMAGGWLKVGDLMRFVSRSVVTGFVNALAILIFMAQLVEFRGAGWTVYAMVAAGLAIIYLLPRVTRAVPSALVCIVVLTAVSLLIPVEVRRVADLGQLPSALPFFSWPDVPWNLATLKIILPTAVALAVVGLLESLMTASIVDDMTETSSNKNRECAGQGLANIVSGCFGGMAGCAMIGQSVINVKSGGRTRLSTLCAGVFLLILIVALGDWVGRIPMPALVAVMIMVSIGTFSWSSLINFRRHPHSSSVVMVCTVTVVVWTHNLALGVGAGVLLSALFFARKVAQVLRVRSVPGTGANSTGGDDDSGIGDDSAAVQSRTYHVQGQVFFASTPAFLTGFDLTERLRRVVIDVTHAHFWDLTAVHTLDKVVLAFRKNGAEVTVLGLNEASATLVDKLGVHNKPDALERLLEH